MIIGIDVGISTTKIVGINEDEIVVSPIRIRATDPVTSLYGAFGKYLYDNQIALSDIEHVMITGVGAAYVNSPIYGLPTDKAEEFIADGLGARYETGLDRMIVVSMGTGTSLVQCDDDGIRHIGGIGIGGGTLAGLSRVILKTDDMKQIVSLAMQGDISNIDLQIGDISPNPLPGLPKHATASLLERPRAMRHVKILPEVLLPQCCSQLGQVVFWLRSTPALRSMCSLVTSLCFLNASWSFLGSKSFIKFTLSFPSTRSFARPLARHSAIIKDNPYSLRILVSKDVPKSFPVNAMSIRKNIITFASVEMVCPLRGN